MFVTKLKKSQNLAIFVEKFGVQNLKESFWKFQIGAEIHDSTNPIP